MSIGIGIGLNLATLGTGGAVSFTPLSLFTGAAGVWYDPSDLTSLSANSDGTGGVPSVGGAVGRILDKSGNAAHMTQPTAGNKPTLQQDAGGRYVLRFDGVDDLMVFTLAGSNTTTMAIAGKLRSAPAAAYKEAFSLVSQVIYANLSGNVWGGYNNAEVPSSTIATSPLVMIERSRAFNDVDLFTNGAKQVVTTGTSYNAHQAGMGGDVASLVQFADFDCYAAFAINRVLTDAEITSLNAWMMAKAGL